VENGTTAQVIASIRETLDATPVTCHWLACINPHSYIVAKHDIDFERALRSADWLIPDGVGVVIAGHMLKRPFQQRITGSDIFTGVMAHLNEKAGSVFFLGSTEITLSRICAKVRSQYPRVLVSGTYSPPFASQYTPSELKDMIDAVNRVKPDVLWVGMTAPKQEKWLCDNASKLDAKFAGAIGAVFDFYTDTIRRPSWIYQRLGLEWLPRLLQEPRRLWRRSFISAPQFFLDVVQESFRKSTANNRE
jgi:N-acetylglucosaminyldiphosphoundecaprenol N-acetyl-beta-D-mannosaminyltransferase